MDYEPELIGGHLSLDLLNTVAWRLDDERRIDRIADPTGLSTWLSATGLPQSKDFQRIARAREAAYCVLQPIAIGAVPEARDVQALRKVMVDAISRAELVRVSPLEWHADDPAIAVALAVWRLLEDEDLSRLRQCQDDACGWLFLDRSKNGSRRWCSSADCGNRARAKRHYQRLHSA
ncbi:MAG TPA: CGNR zinc finger domain-containing protein [Kribbella sp.]|uniref:CGNR zinc finger domain-containing protein n=1 Tax=Kribbella sp. TaxID=1871183 RepID=UPI002D795ACE|nr:CGNR zinc finger domain-containing protein [Kribbella sp.]HET6295133.1 CGNR zinc finger domain-containing protein [Kribbella sp.]